MTVMPRVNARDKVTGALRYAADRVPDRVAYAMLTPATIGKGRVVSVDTAAGKPSPVCG
jgi:xanthine dehydrogenase YagR molybdenum-binding subunit